ncbi:MAG: bifunctional 2-methylcitrate synthase/citrate synthase, partial [Rhodospirillaceae bacterium]|nr:bifunctional 2-methylcitrate synthase/citrate synthase [Rhodospirillaceae bacterium]
MTAAAGKGLEGVVASQTSLSFIDGLKGILVYRGYNIHELAPNVSFPESAFLLWNGRLPRRTELDEFESALAAQRALDPRTVEGLKGLPTETVPMSALRTGVSLEGVYDPDAEDNSLEANRRKAERLVARTPTIIAAIHRIRQGLEPLEPDPTLSLSADFVRMANGEPGTEGAVRALDRVLCRTD